MSLTTGAVRASNGNTVTPTFSTIVSNTHTLAENTFTIAEALNPNKEITTSAMRFTVTAAGKDSVVLNS